MDKYIMTFARVYVSTQKRYAGNNRFGIWVELAGFKERKAYFEHCIGLFPDDPEPEIIHLDWQDIPPCLISANGISAKVFRLIEQIKNMEETQQKGFTLWLARQPDSIYTQKAKEIVRYFTRHYMGYFGYKEQFAEYYASETMGITKESNPHFDFISYTNQLFNNKFILNEGFVFQINKG